MGSTQAASQWKVSMSGGIAPVWRSDGRELYYLNPEGTMMAAPIDIRAAQTSGAPKFKGTPCRDRRSPLAKFLEPCRPGLIVLGF